MRRTIRLCVAGALAASVVVALPAGADGHVEIVLTDLNNPRDVIVHDGDLYVAESGLGGDGPCYTGGEGEACYGPSGAIVRVDDIATQLQTAVTDAVRVHQGLASAAGEDGGGAAGPAGLSVGADGMLYVTIGLGANPDVRDGEPDLFHLGTLMRGSLDGSVSPEHVADIAAFEAANDPVFADYGPDSNPFGVVAGDGTAVVVDSGGNTLLDVDTTGTDAVSLRTAFSPIWSPIPGAPGQHMPAEAVPTQAASHDGGYLVGELTGFPFPPGGARVHEVADATASVLHTGFTNVMDVVVDGDAIYVLELASEGLASGTPPFGSLIRVTSEGGTTVRELVATGMLMPGGVAIDGDDAYVTVGSAGPDGSVVRVDLTADPLLTVRDDAATTDEDMRLVAGDADADQFTTVTADVTANDEGVETVTPLNIAEGAVTTGSIVYQPRRTFNSEDEGIDDVPYRGCDGDGACLNGVLEVTVHKQAIDRIAGIGRMETAVTASMGHYPDGAPVVVVARADLYPDALTGGPLAHMAGGPILLTQGDVLTPVVEAEIRRLAPSTIYVLGGPAAITKDVEDSLGEIAETVTRLGGIDRFETAVKVMEELETLGEGSLQMAYVVEGVDPDPNRGWPDAVSVSGLASWNGSPILLVATEVVPDSTAAALDGIDATIIGGEMAINAATRARIAELADDVTDIAGDNRFETSRLIAEQGVEDRLYGPRLILVSGGNWPDALVAGPLAAQNMQGPMMLVHPTDIAGSPETVEFIDDRGPFVDVDLFGGPAAISDSVAAAIAQANQ